MSDTLDLAHITHWLGETRRPLIISHERPDGDALGSISAMTLALQKLGREPAAVLYGTFPRRYGFLEGPHPWYVWDHVRDRLETDVDSVIVVDTCALSQLEQIAPYLARAPRTLIIDHHVTRDALGTRPGDLRYFDDTAGAAALIVAEWIASAGIELDSQIATALYTGVATDTGWFRFSNTDGRILRTAARMMDYGILPSAIYNALYQQEPIEKLRLISRLFNQLELHAEGRIAVMALRQADFVASGADRSMTEDLVNEAARLRGAEVTLLITEDPDNVVRFNFRSKNDVDVAQLARRYGGGGHARAAGARIRGEWDTVVQRVINDVTDALQHGARPHVFGQPHAEPVSELRPGQYDPQIAADDTDSEVARRHCHAQHRAALR